MILKNFAPLDDALSKEGGLATLRMGVELRVLHPRVGSCTLGMGATLRMGPEFAPKEISTLRMGVYEYHLTDFQILISRI